VNEGTHTAYVPPSAFSVVDDGAIAGLHSYTIKVYVNDSDVEFSADGDVLLQAYEL
jgi:hypothetical protein